MTSLLAPISLDISWWETVARLVAVVVAAALVGWDRESRGHSAGLRTHILVGLGSAGFTLMAFEMFGAAHEGASDTSYDPLRLMSGVIGGVGFLGAGAIIHAGGEVRGLTTAAGIWSVAAASMAIASGAYVLGTTITVLAIVTLALLRYLEPDRDDERR